MAEGYEVLFISILSKLSATNQNAHIAREMMLDGEIEIIDSRTISTGIGLLVAAASDMVKKWRRKK